MLLNDNLIDLSTKFHTTCRPMSRIFILLTVPSALFAIIILCYLGKLPLAVEIHSVILIGFIYFIYLFFVRHNAYYVSCKFKTQYESMFFSLKDYIDNNLLTIDDTTKANGSVDDFLKDYTSNLRNNNFSSIAFGTIRIFSFTFCKGLEPSLYCGLVTTIQSARLIIHFSQGRTAQYRYH